MSETKSFHMSPEEFRRRGHAVVDWIADYHSRIESFPVLSRVRPGEIRSQLPANAPEQGEAFEQILADMERVVLPGITHWQSPNFYAYFPANASGPATLGDFLSAGLGVQGMLWSTSPACTELETHVLDWLVAALGLPQRFLSMAAGGGVIQDTASSAALCAIRAARERAGREQGARSREQGTGGELAAYASTEAHSSIEKGLRIAGLGSESFRRIEVDREFAMRPDCLAEAMAADVAAGRRPCFVCATAGTTSSLAFDPLRSIGQICRQYGAWLHVDAALAGTAAICPEFRAMHDGLDLADSYCFNPHKWMFTNFDCSCFFVADRGPLIRALGIMPEYLKNRATQTGAVIDYRDWQIPLGRRFRALKLWFVVRCFGIAGIQQRVRQHVALAQEFSRWIEADPHFELAAPAALNLVCFRHRGGDEVNQRILDRVNGSGKLFMSHARLHDRLTMRFCVGQTSTERRHVEHAWRAIVEAAQ